MASKHPIEPQLEFKLDGTTIKYKAPGNPYWQQVFGPIWGKSFLCSCCGLRSIDGWQRSEYIPPIPLDIMDEWFNNIPIGARGPEYVGVIATSQYHRGDFYYAIGLNKFFVGKASPNTVHGPSNLQLIRINTTDWRDLWIKSIRKGYVTWYNKQVKIWRK